jgi:hypothetical protein
MIPYLKDPKEVNPWKHEVDKGVSICNDEDITKVDKDRDDR